MMKCSFVFFLALVFSLALAPVPMHARPKRPKPDLKFIENGEIKLGMDRSMGASITWLSWKGHEGNIINIHDPGRLLQQSYYAGKSLERIADGQHKAWSPWTWNPIQGGGVNSWARVTKFKKPEHGKIFAETVPKLWDMHDEEAEALMQQQVGLVKGAPNVIEVSNRLVCKRKPGDRWGDRAVARHQELPACYFISEFRHFECYLGRGRWKKVEQSPGPPWGQTTPPLKIMACFNDAGQGVAIFSPAATEHWNFGPHQKYQPNAAPTGGPCVHMAPIAKVKLGPKSILQYRYWLVTGERESIAARLDELLKQHADEKLKLENP